jgi:type I restriction enzyme M protein
MPNISSIIKNVRNIMRQDCGVSGDAQRLEQLGWHLFLKILDQKDQELELLRDRHQSVIPEKFRWRNWATNPEGITGEELILFIDHPTDGLFATLKNLKAAHAPQRAALVKEVFDGSNNYMKSGYELRKVIRHRPPPGGGVAQSRGVRCRARIRRAPQDVASADFADFRRGD